MGSLSTLLAKINLLERKTFLLSGGPTRKIIKSLPLCSPYLSGELDLRMDADSQVPQNMVCNLLYMVSLLAGVENNLCSTTNYFKLMTIDAGDGILFKSETPFQETMPGWNLKSAKKY
jgi:hypothetical protein